MVRQRSLKAFVLMALFGAGAATAQTDLVTAVRDGSGNLKLISWNANGIRQNPPPREATAGAIDLLAAVRLIDARENKRMVTAVRNDRGDLLLIPWRVGFDGTITRIDQAQGAVNRAGTVSRIAAIGNRTGDRVVTAVRDGSGRLRVISWLVSASAGVVSRISGSRCGDLVPPGTLEFQTSVRDGSGRLALVKWRTSDNGETITRFPAGETRAGGVSLISTACYLVP